MPYIEKPKSESSSLAKFPVVISLALALLACGRPATEDECREILRRTAELEMQGRLGDKSLIEAEVRAIEGSMHSQMMKKCVGKRITEDALRCVRTAKTAKELTETCFR